MRDTSSSQPAPDDRDTSTRPATYIVLAALLLLTALAIATWSEHSFKVRPASASAQAMSLAGAPPEKTPARPE